MLYQTHALIHLNNIKHNIEEIRRVVDPKYKILLSIKANAYGHGAVEIALMAQKNKLADYLAIATVPEGMELREAGVTLPVLKLSPAFEVEMESAVANEIALCVCEEENIRKYDETARAMGKKAVVHLQLDTGMGRIGVGEEEGLRLAEIIIKQCPNLELEGVMTHMPVSDDSSRTFTERQIDKFYKIVNKIETSLNFKFKLVHCSNSAAITAYPNAHYNMVRPGIIIYGFYPSKDVPQTLDLRPGMSVKTRVSFIKKVAKGNSVGYGRTWVAPEDTWIATFPAGYADGFNRQFSNRGRVLINGMSCPVVGRICMDQSMCSLGTGEKPNVKVGDEVVLLGKSGNEEITGEEWAEKLGTISYEVTCLINHRLQRYYEE